MRIKISGPVIAHSKNVLSTLEAFVHSTMFLLGKERFLSSKAIPGSRYYKKND